MSPSALGIVASSRYSAGSGVSVIEIADTYGTANINPVTLSLSTTPQAGDVVVLMYRTITSTRSASSISGLGATWTRKGTNNGTTGRDSVWVGTGATSSGTISVTQNAVGGAAVRAYLVRGLANTNTNWLPTSGNPANTNPTLTAQSGQFVAMIGQATISGFGTPSPTSGWVGSTITGSSPNQSTDSYRIPTEGSATNHQRPITGNFYAFIAVVG